MSSSKEARHERTNKRAAEAGKPPRASVGEQRPAPKRAAPVPAPAPKAAVPKPAVPKQVAPARKPAPATAPAPKLTTAAPAKVKKATKPVAQEAEPSAMSSEQKEILALKAKLQ